MKLRSPLFIFFLVAMAIVALAVSSHAQSWDFGNGVVLSLPTSPNAAMPLMGGDFLNKQLIVGASTRMASLWKTLNADAGIVGEFNSQSDNAQPYAALGFDILRFFPGVPATGLEVQAGLRYVASTSAHYHLGPGVAIAYQWGQPAPAITPSVKALMPVASKLSLIDRS